MIRSIQLSSLVVAMCTIGPAWAQSETAPQEPQQRTEVTLQSLQSLISAMIYQRQPLDAASTGNATGATADHAFARIVDAKFARDGRLIELCVTEPAMAAGSKQQVIRSLPITATQWDGRTRRWLVADPTVKPEGLTEVPAMPTERVPTEKMPTEKMPSKAVEPVMASRLVNAPVAAGAIPEKVVDRATETAGKERSAVVWLAPSGQAIAFAVVQLETKFVPVPWSLIEITDHGNGLQMRVTAKKEQLDAAPNLAAPDEVPSPRIRQQCYRHFGLDVPDWDGRAPESE
jgi:hypothetical protein